MMNHSDQRDSRRSAFRVVARNPAERVPHKFARHWVAVVDWLGGRRPLDPICGVLAIIALIATIHHALS
jgi:hypothetical protein